MDRKNLAVLCACAAAFAFSSNYTNHAPLLGSLMKQFGFSQAMAGLLTTGIFLTHAGMQIPGGHLADRFGGRLVLAWALAVVCLGNIGIAYSGSYGQLLFWKVFAGLGTGTCFVAGARYLAQTIPPQGLARAQGFYGGSVLLGSGFVIYAVPRAAEFAGWQGAFWTTASVAVAVLLLWVLSAPAPLPQTHAHVALSTLIGHRQLWLLGSVQMASFGLVILIGSWITLLLHNQLGLAPTKAGALGSLVLLLGIISRPLGGMLAAVMGMRPLLAAGLVMNLAGCLLLAGASSLGSALAAIVLLGAGCGLPYASLFNRAAVLFPGRAGAAMGLVNMLGILMILVGAPAVGKIADWTGSFQASFVALAGFNAAVLLAVAFIRE
jgi:NNP family nitrate/nitrite transporter-like MFS transporter